MLFEEASESSRVIVWIHKIFNHIDFHIQTSTLGVIPTLPFFLTGICE